MVILAKQMLNELSAQYPGAAEALRVWYAQVDLSDWASWADVKASFASANYVGNDRYAFAIYSNHYHLITRIHFASRTVYIRFIGTQIDCDKVNVSTV